MPFKPGESGNPSGKPKGALNKQTAAVRRWAGRYTHKAIEALAEVAFDKEAPHVARVAAQRELLDRAVGKPAQAIVGHDGGALQLMSKVIHEHLLAAPRVEVEEIEGDSVKELGPGETEREG